jgi:hypothetical protein
MCIQAASRLRSDFTLYERYEGVKLFVHEPEPKLVEQYQPAVFHVSLRRDGVNGGMGRCCLAPA